MTNEHFIFIIYLFNTQLNTQFKLEAEASLKFSFITNFLTMEFISLANTDILKFKFKYFETIEHLLLFSISR